MMIFLIVSACLLWVLAVLALPRRILIAPALSYCAMLVLSFAKMGGVPLLPLPMSLILSWLAITLVVMICVILQNPAIRMQSRGVWYMTIGGIAGLSVGLLGYTFSGSLNLLYGIMILGCAAGIFFGMTLFSRTQSGEAVGPGSGNFFRYLLAKGFPILITLVQMGIPAIILIQIYK